MKMKIDQNLFQLLLGPTYWPSSTKKNPDILDIFITKFLNYLFCNTENILDLNSDHFSIVC